MLTVEIYHNKYTEDSPGHYEKQHEIKKVAEFSVPESPALNIAEMVNVVTREISNFQSGVFGYIYYNSLNLRPFDVGDLIRVILEGYADIWFAYRGNGWDMFSPLSPNIVDED